MFILLKNKEHYIKIGSLAAILIVMSFSPFKIIPMIACLLFWAIYWPFSAKWSLVLRLVMAFLLITCFQQVLGVLAWILHVPITIPLVVAAELLISYIMYRRRPAGVSVLKVFDIDDYVSLFATTVTMAVLGLFILHAGPTINTLIRFNTTAIDDAAHLSLTLTDYDNMGYVYGPTSSVRDKIPSQQTVSYPQGWHLSNSLWWYSVSDNLGTSSLLDIRNILILFTLSRLIWYALVVFLIARLIIYLAKLARPQLSSGILLSGAMVLSLVGFLQVTWMLELLKNGFSSFLPQLAYMLALVFFAGEFFKKNSKQDKVDRYIIATSLLTAGMSLVWLLAMPVGIGAILLGLILKYNERYLQTVRRLFSKKYVQSTILSSLIIMCGLVQVAVQILYPSGSN